MSRISPVTETSPDAVTGEQEPVAWQWLVGGDTWTPCEPPSEDELRAMSHKFRPLYLGRMPAPACHDSHNSGENDPAVTPDCAGAGSSLTEVQALQREIIDRQAEIQRLRGLAQCSREAREKEITRLATIAECAKIADDHTPAKHEGTLAAHVTGSVISKAIRALTNTSTLGNSK